MAACLLALAACGTAPPDESGAQTTVEEPPASQPVLAEPNPDLIKPAETDLAVAVPPPLPDPEKLMGLGEEAVSKLLGAPAFTRQDTPARIWQYHIDACILDLFLYQQSSGYRVAHYEIRGRDVVKPSPRECFAALMKAKNKQP